MKKIAFAISALLVGVPAFAADTGLLTSGSVGAGFGVRDCSNTDDESCGSHTAYDLTGRVSIPFATSYAVQLDGAFERYTSPKDKDNQVTKQNTYGLHLSYRNPDRYLAGVFVGYGQGEIDDKTQGKMIGIEGQYYFDRVTLYAQMGHANINNIPDSDNQFKGHFTTLAVRYFPSDDLMLQAGFAYGKSPSGYEDLGSHQWGKAKDYFLEGKMRVMDSQPVYGIARFQHSTYVANSEDDGSESRFMIGISYDFGAPTLYAADRRGATLATPSLPGRAASWAEALD